MAVTNKFMYGQNPDEINYWVENRSKLSDLYKSERHFFEKVLPQVNSVMDIGCAAGGSAIFSRELGNNPRYTGLDVSTNLVEAAKKRFTDEETQFYLYDGNQIPMKDNSHELVFSFGVFHHLGNWKELVNESLRVSSKYFLFDIRCWSGETIMDIETSYQKLALAEKWDLESIIPYNLISFNDFFEFASKLKTDGYKVDVFSYWRKPTDLAVTPAKEVLMTSVLIEKNSNNPEFKLIIE